MQINRVLVPIDFSSLSRLALNHALVFARKCHARIILLHVVELTSDPINQVAEIERQHQEQAERMLGALIATEDQRGLNIENVVKSGTVEDEILATTQQYHCDLVVMGTHGRGLIGRWLIGSTTQAILRRSQIPVLTLCRVARPQAFGQILLATDLSTPRSDSFRATLDLAGLTQAKVLAMHAVEVGVEGGAEAAVYLGKELAEDARVQLVELQKEASRRNIQLSIMVDEGAAASLVLNAAAQQDVDLIVISIEKDSSKRQNTVGPTAEEIIRSAHVPVLSIPADREPRSVVALEEPPAA